MKQKKRKAFDPYYGKVPKAGPGSVISNPIELKPDGSLHMNGTALDPVELRRAALFWDHVE